MATGPTIDELEAALRKADAAGDAESAKVLADAIRGMQSSRRSPAQMAESQPQTGWDKFKDTFIKGPIDRMVAGGETAMNMASSAAVTPVAGLAGIAQGAKNLVSPGMPAGERVRQISDTLTYQPQTEAGVKLNEVATYPFQKIAEAGDFVGSHAAEATGSPAVGASANAAIQALPALLLRRIAKPGETLTPKTASRNALATQQAEASAEAAATKAGLDWDKLPGQVKAKITEFAKDATAFKAVSPQELERIARAESLPASQLTVNNPKLPNSTGRSEGFNLTKGQASREPSQLRTEEILAQDPASRAILDRHMDQNASLIKNLDVLKGRTGAKATSATQVGERVAGERQNKGPEGALKMAERKSNENISSLYKKAEQAGEMADTIDIKPLVEYMRVHDDPSRVSFAANKLKALKLVKEDEFGNLQPTHNITLNQLEGIRKAAATTARLSSDGVNRYYAGELVGEIDKMIPGNAGGAEYRAARQARKDHAMKFEEPQVIDKLIGDKSRTDRKVALENVWDQAVLKGSIADLTRVRDNLLNNADKATRDSGRKAWREIAGQTIEYIKDAATKSIAQDARGNQNLLPSALKKAINQVGEDKLEIILGKTAVKQLKDIQQVATDVKTLPPTKVGSTTVNNLMSLLNSFGKVIGHVPGAGITGNLARGALEKAKDVYKTGKQATDVKSALRDPLVETPPQPSAQVPSRFLSPSEKARLMAGKWSPGATLSQEGRQQQ